MSQSPTHRPPAPSGQGRLDLSPKARVRKGEQARKALLAEESGRFHSETLQAIEDGWIAEPSDYEGSAPATRTFLHIEVTSTGKVNRVAPPVPYVYEPGVNGEERSEPKRPWELPCPQCFLVFNSHVSPGPLCPDCS